MKINAYRRLQAASKFFDQNYLTNIISDTGYKDDDISRRVGFILKSYNELSNGGKLDRVWDRFESLIINLDNTKLLDSAITNEILRQGNTILNIIDYFDMKNGSRFTISTVGAKLTNTDYFIPTLQTFKDLLIKSAQEIEDDLKANGYIINSEISSACEKASLDI